MYDLIMKRITNNKNINATSADTSKKSKQLFGAHNDDVCNTTQLLIAPFSGKHIQTIVR